MKKHDYLKKFHLYILYDTKTLKPVYVGLTSGLKNRIHKHSQTKKFDGVLIIESFDNKEQGLSAERCIIKFLSAFKLDSIVNGLYSSFEYSADVDGFHSNLINKIQNGRLG
jgi:hypothetical protein